MHKLILYGQRITFILTFSGTAYRGIVSDGVMTELEVTHFAELCSSVLRKVLGDFDDVCDGEECELLISGFVGSASF